MSTAKKSLKGVDAWLNLIDQHDQGDASIVLAGTKVDDTSSISDTIKQKVLSFANKKSLETIFTSAKDATGIFVRIRSLYPYRNSSSFS